MDQVIIDEIKRIVHPDNVRIDEIMSGHTTFRIGGMADVFVSIINDHELVDLISFLKNKDIPFFIIGKGSNLLVSDKGYRGVIIEIGSCYSGLHMLGNDIVAKAGTPMSKLSHFAMEQGYTGLEFASGIPGTVGGGFGGPWLQSAELLG